MSNKRPAETEQSVDTFAVCTNCSRLSTNLHTCDKCGSKLSEDNAALCYSSEPKRARTEPTSTELTNGSHSPLESDNQRTSPSNVTSSNTSRPEPVPQGLFMNRSVHNGTSTPSENAAPSIRPQTLFVNRFNSAVPVMQMTTGPRAAAPTSTPSVRISASTPVLGSVSTSSSVTNNSNSSGATIQQTGPPNVTVTGPPAPLPSMTSSQSRSTMNNAPPPYSQAVNAPQSSPAGTTPLDNKVSIEASQIRIGLRRFIPATSVTFKTEGVLFSLKDYTSAPVLLNARAIVKCKIHYGPLFPAFFFHLEASCVKQIQHIFNLNPNTFSDDGPAESRKYISIFPSSLSESEKNSIRGIFGNMKTKYNWNNYKIIQISQNEVLDILYGDDAIGVRTTSNNTSNNTALSRSSIRPGMPQAGLVGGRGGPPLPAPPPLASQPMRGGMGPRGSLPASQMLQAMNSNPQMNYRMGQGSIGAGTNFSMTSPVPVPRPQGGFGSATPTLVIPHDTSKWQQMQKNLVSGGVYQVVMQDGQKKFCLWNGTSLLPCLVQDSEVQLQCTHVRVGSLKAMSGGCVRVRNEGLKSGISFHVAVPGSGSVEIFVPTQELASILLCTERICAMFVYAINNSIKRIRQLCKMNSSTRDPTYNPGSGEERQQHIILFLKDVNKDQKDALLKMVRPASNPPKMLIEDVQVLHAMGILSRIKQNSFVQAKISDYMDGNRRGPPGGNESLEELTRAIRDPDVTSNNRPPPVDDDDDDVIMTQEEVGIKCPYTQQVMKDPVRNKHCGHNYEKVAIMEFIARRRGKTNNAKCPYAGCGNPIPLMMEDLVDNAELKAHIQSIQNKS